MAGYLGDRKNMIVHHLGNMQKECSIYDMRIIDRQYFTPDKIETATQLGFKPCVHCN